MSILVEQRGAVRIVTIDRPERRNALDLAAMSAIGRIFTEAIDDDSVACLVLTGSGDKAFSAGMDLKAFAAGEPSMPQDGSPGLEVLLSNEYPKPIVGAANGTALAGGFELLLCCDLVVAAEGAEFGIPEATRGLVAAGGGVLLLPQRIPLAIAMELGLTGARISAERAHELGLVNRVVPADQVLDSALELADAVAASAPLAVRFTKEHMRDAAHSGNEDGRRRFSDEVAAIFASEDAKEGATAFAERRPPVWKGR
ncbi:MAG TPA: enoyl-CoA hydratase-related protein [Microthrixaceae bacterium]|nr:enoyl-CoA hydratase-related protein [Microthrixaceae bacterium]